MYFRRMSHNYARQDLSAAAGDKENFDVLDLMLVKNVNVCLDCSLYYHYINSEYSMTGSQTRRRLEYNLRNSQLL